MKVFITGGTGFLGKVLVKKLVERGNSVKALVRTTSNAEKLKVLGVTLCYGDIRDINSIEEGMEGCDIVFHLAAWYELGIRDKQKMYDINVGGTENIMEVALKLSIPKIIYCSTTAVLGNTKGKIADESQIHCGRFYSQYEKTKYLAHEKVKQYILYKNLPVIIVMPGVIYGPEDKKESTIAKLINDYINRTFPAMVKTETTFTCVYVDDVVEGILLALEKGVIGESYILGGEILKVKKFIELIGKFSGIPAPKLEISLPIARLMCMYYQLKFKLFGIISPITKEVLNIIGGTTWSFDSTKAQKELRWKFRTVEEGLKETVEWYMKNKE